MPDSANTAPTSLDPTALGLQAALISGDHALAYRLVSDLMAEGVSFDRILFDVLAPLQRDVGARWLQGDYRIAEEHAASAAVETLVALFSGTFEAEPDGRHVVIACAEGEDHSLPARMIAAYLVYLGWHVTFLGATLPAEDLASFLAEQRPAALLLSCSAVRNLPGARECIRTAHEVGVPVVAGGHAFGGDARRATALGADAWVADPRELEGLLDGWEPNPAAAEASAQGDDEAVALRNLLPGAVEAAVAATDAPNPASLRRDLRLLGETLMSAVLVDDRTILDEFMEWHRTRHRTHADEVPTDHLVGLLEAHLHPSLERARDLLA